MRPLLLSLAIGLLLAACAVRTYLPSSPSVSTDVYRIVPAPQAQGDPQKGWEYLVYGDYIGSGIPMAVLGRFYKGYRDTVFHRSGPSGGMEYSRNVFSHANGTLVFSGNCFTCHAGQLQGRVIPGLGNTLDDYSPNQALQVKLLYWNVARKYGKSSPEWEATDQTARYYLALAPRIRTNFAGVNPAFRLEEACVSQRAPGDLSYRAEPQFAMTEQNIASDVPPLWHLKKKGALYYNGMGRGDFAKLLMQASVLGIADSAEARRIQGRMADVLAWIQALEPPRWPGSIDAPKAAAGRLIFNERCAKCHGRYDEEAFYPNKIVPLREVGTDSLYAWYFLNASGLASWYNQSWYALSPPRSELKPSYGYIAPPLDGIWATAPYLHNGSVPTLAALLDSRQRPESWRRSGPDAYDFERVGWQYEAARGSSARTYQTSLPGYGNQGHYFADTLAKEERLALLEYLKTL
jgi:mono/diheme cytochrome c family protein